MQEGEQKNEASWAFHDEAGAYTEPIPERKPVQHGSISWSGSEFIAKQKTAGWYLGLAGFIVAICAVIYLISKDIISIIFVGIMGILFAIIAGRKPRQLQYAIDDDGIHVGQKSYLFTDFKSFSLQHDGAIGYISLLPLHRFHNELSIYFPPENEQQIFDVLSQHVPNEQRKETYIDKLTKLIRF